LQHHRSADDTLRHLEYWESRFSDFALVYLTPELLGKERQLLLDIPTVKGIKRTHLTVNRYMASLSSLLSYATQRLNWIKENPVFRLIKLKENPGRDRVLSEDEITRLLSAAKESKSPYLYCIILLALTTGARQGEILNLEWRHIDFQNRIAYIKETKNGRPRSIALCDPVIEEHTTDGKGLLFELSVNGATPFLTANYLNQADRDAATPPAFDMTGYVVGKTLYS